ncbi:bifunctional [glutamine synthetase] adenylyltransferase/[glutamine synthetase]-adenylyl-L-tyrosine phosphorylase [Actinoplanes awajinensis]|uniref:Bifunctional glutamine-synthetase adenylyltransferase/deadenyltransferase n=1 Tax=Actinoplanes awajinensis subsp. mycoplanecinus TaxID=135947 RepID=A0A0X3VBZ9_9ACTN|nr:bifunctional [glutamine synthetase] adenylyltransferase/[glutamine synthetase]-adenylyl-L-tyrosine phosphorylase [Actinoplanes awajinensis]KUL42321.1 bifunctional glutamine-synthetase adenylyltransferase/deadenyltransferase [Actinoplanes awajinensis subsp. mycoplanecinus]
MTRPTRLARYGFADNGAKAADLLGENGLRLWDAGHGPVSADAAELIHALSRAADPNLALRQFHRLVDSVSRAAERAGGARPTGPAGDIVANAATVELTEELFRDHGLRRRLVAVLGASSTLGDHLVANEQEWRTLATTKSGLPPDPEGHLELDAPTVPALRRAYRISLLRIAAADLTGGRGLEPTMAALSLLADETLAAAYAIAVAGLPAGTPEPRLAVVAMGKCGGNELNYISDVDVIFVAAGDEDLQAGTTVAVRLMEICGQVAWPVDAALRPEGSRGPLVRTLASHQAYYRRWARTWEFQALLKARPAAGDQALADEWLADLAPLVWHAAERPEAVADVRDMRRRIIENVPAKELDREIKRGPGGLRDIEFAVQLLQLVHGRVDETLRLPGTLPALRALVAGGYVGRQDGETLLRGYRFLRAVEHRLQLQNLRRTHTVPDDPAGVRWLAAALGYTALPGRDAVEAFRSDWVGHAANVRRLHVKLLYQPLLEAVARVPAEALRMTPASARKRLEILGFADPVAALRHLEALTGGVTRTSAIQRTLLPMLLQDFADAPEPDRGLLNYRHVSDKLGSTPWYLRLLRDGGPVARRLARVLSLSRYATDLLTRDPEALRLLADDAELQPRPRAKLLDGFVAAAVRHADDPVKAIAAVRAQRRRELFRLACADILSHGGDLAPAQPIDVHVLGAALSDVTDATLNAALHIARQVKPGPPGLRFAIIGMGRLGGYEMSYPSDADVLFVYAGPDEQSGPAAHAIAEELRRLLNAPAPDPALGIDADLRPEGRQGPLVRSLQAYQQYYDRWSKVWEAQALLRARYVCGDESLGREFEKLADTKRYPTGGLSREQVIEIRRIKARVETERMPRGADPNTHTKLGRGGLADVEWAVQLQQLRYAHEHPELRMTSTLEALAAQREAGLVDPADAEEMTAGWTLAAQVRNALTLVRGRPTDQLPQHGVELAGTVLLLGGGDPGEFVDRYLRITRRSRAAMQRVMEA